MKGKKQPKTLGKQSLWGNIYTEEDFDFQESLKFKGYFMGTAVFGQDIFYDNDKHEDQRWFQYAAACPILEAEPFDLYFREPKITNGNQHLVTLKKKDIDMNS